MVVDEGDEIMVEEVREVSSSVAELEELPVVDELSSDAGPDITGDELTSCARLGDKSEETHGLSTVDTSDDGVGEVSSPQAFCEEIDMLLYGDNSSSTEHETGTTPDTSHGIYVVGASGVEETTLTTADVDPEVEPSSTGQTTPRTPEEGPSDDGDVQYSGEEKQSFAYPEIKLGDIHNVKICHIQSPSSFFCQLASTSNQLVQLMEIIQAKYIEPTDDTASPNTPVDTPTVDTPTVDTSTVDTPTVDTSAIDPTAVDTTTVDTPTHDTPTIDTPTLNTPCCAQSPNDAKWYRALVTKIHEHDVDVSFVDFGTTASVPLGKLRVLPGDLVASMPRQAILCALVDLASANSEWSAEAVTKMREVCLGKELEAIFRSRRHKKYEIYLRDSTKDVADFVNKLLVDLKLAKVTGADSESDEVIEKRTGASQPISLVLVRN